MDFITGLLDTINWKSEIYYSILVIVNRLKKMIYFEPVMKIILALGLTKVITEMVVRHYGLSDLTDSGQSSVFS